jgi:hypothetical protein
VTALFVLLAPLCAIACLPTADIQGTADSEHGNSPCHESAPSSQPSEPEKSNGDCGCEDSYTAVVPIADQTSTNLPSTAVVLEAAISDVFVSEIRPVARAQLRETDLPPPDILLRKSTLLI